MTHFGESLRQEREARGVGIPEICAKTKIAEHHVLALEAGDLKFLPGGVFRKGILRGYLQTVGLEEALWMERFTRVCTELRLGEAGELDWAEFAVNVKRGRGKPRDGMARRWFGVAFMVVSLWAIAWLAWWFVRHHRMVVRDAAQIGRVSQGEPDHRRRGVRIDIVRKAFFTHDESSTSMNSSGRLPPGLL